jgi:hypothetical protein
MPNEAEDAHSAFTCKIILAWLIIPTKRNGYTKRVELNGVDDRRTCLRNATKCLAIAIVTLLGVGGCAAPAAHLVTGDTGVGSPLMQAMQAPSMAYNKKSP